MLGPVREPEAKEEQRRIKDLHCLGPVTEPEAEKENKRTYPA